MDGTRPNVDGTRPNVDGTRPNVDGTRPNVDCVGYLRSTAEQAHCCGYCLVYVPSVLSRPFPLWKTIA